MRRTLCTLGLLVLAGCPTEKGDTTTPTYDSDGDGVYTPDDCDDSHAGVFPGAPETCDGVDQDCDGLVDEDAADAVTLYADGDGDGWGADEARACPDAAGFAPAGGDCDDEEPAVNPEADEACNEVDDDCDGTTDEDDAVDASTWYPDADRDGVGDAAGATVACAAPEGAVATGGDCDDADPTVGAPSPERCDGLDNDCDPTTGEAGLAWWVAADGTGADLTATLAAGTPGAPVALDLEGELHLCDGTWYALLSAESDARVVGHPGEAAVVVDGGGAGTVLTVLGAAVAVSDVTLRGGFASYRDVWGYRAGGGVACAGDGTLTLDRVEVRDNVGDIAGGLYVGGCTVDAVEAVVAGNSGEYGGGVFGFAGDIRFTDSEISGNYADGQGGGIDLEGVHGPVRMTLVSSTVRGNVAYYGAGIGILRDATVTCIADPAERAGVLANSALQFGGGAYIIQPSTEPALVSAGCDWGADASHDDNGVEDVFLSATWASWYFEDDATFTCSETSCS